MKFKIKKHVKKQEESKVAKVSLRQEVNNVAVCINGVAVAFLSGNNCGLCTTLMTDDEAATISPVFTEEREGYRGIKIII